MKRTSSENLNSTKQLSRRALVIGGMQLSMIAALGVRMRFLQINEAEKYRLLAEENRINVRLLPPSRGLIFDREGRLVAENLPNYRIGLIREDTGDLEEILTKLQNLIYIRPKDLTKARKELLRVSSFVPVTLAENLSWADFAKVAANAPALQGVFTDVGLTRIYAQNENLAHVVGYVGPVSDHYLKQIEDPDPLLQIPRFQVGKTGVEAQMESKLRGSAGLQRVEVNSAGRIIRELERIEGDPGTSTQLTIDSKIQNYALARLGNLSASAVVIDCFNGDVLAVGSSPSFDPNLFVTGISTKKYDALRNDVFGPLRAKAVQGTYAPASTFKMITALAALEAGVLKPDDEIICTGHLEVSNNKFHCWKAHGPMNLEDAIIQSCDVFFYSIGQKVGIDRISNMAKRFGLGVKHDLPLSAISRGVAPTREWKKKSFEKNWLLGDTVNASIGQGFVLASPLQLAVMAARLGTGQAIQPRLIQNMNNVNISQEPNKKLNVNSDHLALVQKAMFGVTNTKAGTAYSRRIETNKFRMSGKTGTAQVRRITAAEREQGVISNKDLPWQQRDHALFVDYAPADNPKVAVAVVVEHGGGGSSVAAPIGRDITLFALTGELPNLKHYPTKFRREIQLEQEDIAPRLIDWTSPKVKKRSKA